MKPQIVFSTLLLRSVTLIALAVAAGAASAQAPHLLPAPREAQWKSGSASVHALTVQVPGADAEDTFAARDLEEAAKANGLAIQAAAPYRVLLLRDTSAEAHRWLTAHNLEFAPAMQAEGYVLAVDEHQATIVGHTATGVFYGVQTLKQLLPLRGEPQNLPLGVVRDWPAMKYRGIDDDLSRGPFPTLDFIKHQIRVFASFKANIYSPYLEHTLLFTQHPLAAPRGSSLTPEEVKELIDYARLYHIDVIPEQEAFGHLHHTLKYELYRDAAETPHGHVLAPGQAETLPLIKDWFQQIADEFPSPFLHIGADETFDLGQGRTAEAVASRGYGPVYVDFLTQIHDTLKPLNRKLLFWGDIGTDDPTAVARLPKDMIAVPWNYWDKSGFEKMIEPFAKNGIETWVAPGDGNWSEVYPSLRMAFDNIQGFIRDGQKMGSTGALTTVWNDDGEGLFNLDWYPVLFGAVAAWQPGESSIADYQAGYGRIFHGDRSGRIDQAQAKMLEAMTALASSHAHRNSDTIFWIDPWSTEGREVAAKVMPNAHEIRMKAEEAIELVARARRENPDLRERDVLDGIEMAARRLDLIGMKFQLAQEIVKDYTYVYEHQNDTKQRAKLRNMLDEISGMNGRCQDLRDAYSALKTDYTQVWMSENRPYWLNNVTVRYDLRIEEWQKRGERFRGLMDDLGANRPLPSPESLGLPPVQPAPDPIPDASAH